MKNKKTILSVFLVLLMIGSHCLTAFAVDGNVSYQGEADRFIFSPGSQYSPTDLFDNFKSVMPGDSLTQQVFVKNNAGKKVKIKVFMRALGAQKETEAFLSQMNLIVNEEENAELYNAPADQTAQLSDWVCLGTLFPDGEILLNLTLDVPITMNDEFQNAIGYLNWEFKVEEIPVKPDDTGDSFRIGVWALIIALACVVLVILIRLRKNDPER